MIKLYKDNIWVEEVKKNSTAGGLIVNQDESSSYIYCKVIDMSKEAEEYFNDTDIRNKYLLVHRVAKFPFIGNTFFISYQDVRAVFDTEFWEKEV